MRSRVLTFVSLLPLFFAAALPCALAADTLVTKAADGSFAPGAAAKWSASGDTVTFELNAGVDGNQVATVLRERLASAKVSVTGNKLAVSGIPMPTLLDQLSTLSLTGEGDPLAVLASLGGGGVAGNDKPEGGGSIRASKPTALPAQAMAGATPAATTEDVAAERFEADVLDVQRGAFPQVTLKLKIRRGASAQAMKAKFAPGKSIEAPVTMGAGDIKDPAMQRNLVAFYLKKGDRVVVHAIESASRLSIDWLERK